MSETLQELERVARRLRALRERRDVLIVQASTEGDSLRTIASASGLTHTAIAKTLRRQS